MDRNFVQIWTTEGINRNDSDIQLESCSIKILTEEKPSLDCFGAWVFDSYPPGRLVVELGRQKCDTLLQKWDPSNLWLIENWTFLCFFFTPWNIIHPKFITVSFLFSSTHFAPNFHKYPWMRSDGSAVLQPKLEVLHPNEVDKFQPRKDPDCCFWNNLEILGPYGHPKTHGWIQIYSRTVSLLMSKPSLFGLWWSGWCKYICTARRVATRIGEARFKNWNRCPVRRWAKASSGWVFSCYLRVQKASSTSDHSCTCQTPSSKTTTMVRLTNEMHWTQNSWEKCLQYISAFNLNLEGVKVLLM